MACRNWQFPLHPLSLLWELWEHSCPCGCNWFCSVYTYTWSSVHKRSPNPIHFQFILESSIHPQQYEYYHSDHFQSLCLVSGKMPFFTRKFGTSYSYPALFCGCFCSPPLLQCDAHAWAIFDYTPWQITVTKAENRLAACQLFCLLRWAECAVRHGSWVQ